MKEKIIYLLLITLPLPIMFWFVKDFEQKYDWFLFDDFEQKIKWYVHYTAYHLENIIKTSVIYLFSRAYLTKKEEKVTMSLLLLAIFRLIEYWLFRNHVPMTPIIGLILMYTLHVYSTNGRKNIINS